MLREAGNMLVARFNRFVARCSAFCSAFKSNLINAVARVAGLFPRKIYVFEQYEIGNTYTRGGYIGKDALHAQRATSPYDPSADLKSRSASDIAAGDPARYQQPQRPIRALSRTRSDHARRQ